MIRLNDIRYFLTRRVRLRAQKKQACILQIRQMLEKEKILEQMAEADKQRVKFGGPGICPTCGEIVANLALHAARCGKYDYFGEPILKELAEANIESNIELDPGTVRQIQDTGRSIRQ